MRYQEQQVQILERAVFWWNGNLDNVVVAGIVEMVQNRAATFRSGHNLPPSARKQAVHASTRGVQANHFNFNVLGRGFPVLRKLLNTIRA